MLAKYLSIPQVGFIVQTLPEQYQNLLKSRDCIDYDEMILTVLGVLENDRVRRLWQKQVFYSRFL